MTTEGFQDVKSVRSIMYYFFRVVYLGWGKLTSSYSCTKDAENIITIFLFLKDRYVHVCLTYICLAKSLFYFAALIFTSFLYCFLRFLNIVLNEFIVF